MNLEIHTARAVALTFRAAIADDAQAATCQSLAQYRNMLIEKADKFLRDLERKADKELFRDARRFRDLPQMFQYEGVSQNVAKRLGIADTGPRTVDKLREFVDAVGEELAK